MTTVLHLSPTFYSSSSVIGGGEKYVLYMAKSLMKAAKARGAPLQTALVAVGEANGVHPVADGIELHIIPGRAWDASSLDGTAIRRVMNDFEVIFIHQCLCGFGLFLAAQARMLGKILIGLDHGGGEHPLVARSKEVGTMFDLFLAYSDFGRHAFADLEGDVLMVRGPVDTDYYAPSFSTNGRSNDVIALGRWLPHKGLDRIIESLPKEQRLKIIGSRTDEDYYQYLNELASGKSVVFIEGLGDSAVRDVLCSAGLFVHASCHFDYQRRFYAKPELLGLAPLEALACGTPALVSNAGSLSELAILNGCRVFSDDHGLTELLEAHAVGGLRWPTPISIHSDVEAKFGMLQYGDKILNRIEKLTRQ